MFVLNDDVFEYAYLHTPCVILWDSRGDGSGGRGGIVHIYTYICCCVVVVVVVIGAVVTVVVVVAIVVGVVV